MTLEFLDNTLQLNGTPLLSELPVETEAVIDADGVGAFLRFTAEENSARHILTLGRFPVVRWTAARRNEPFWMLPAVGNTAGAVPVETQFLLAQTPNDTFVLIVPLLDGAFRATLQGNEQTDELQVIVESGDAAVVGREFTPVFIAAGDDPFTLIESAARVVKNHMGTGRLREEKADAAFSDVFGWCTWDAFYQDVSHDKVREGLESFARGGVQPRLLILDDGWQSVRETPVCNKQLTSFAPNEKFGGDLSATVQMAKSEFGIETFMVWHAFNGYWGGVDGESLSGYGTRDIERRSSPGMLHYNPTLDSWWGKALGVVAPEHIYRFYHDYHRSLRAQGVDGVKVDVQAALEAVAQGLGGRVALMRAYREALEGSVAVHFKGNLINCMSCSNDMLYQASSSTLTRTSTDFWPNIASSHGLHLWTNAIVSLWFGQFVQPDWDMFQSAHPMGAYHAAARAVAGCPVYVSDKPNTHDFDLLRKIVLPDGSVLTTQSIGLPTRDSLFADPTKEAALLKLWNLNTFGGVVGVFNGRYGTGEVKVGSASDEIPSEEKTVAVEAQADANKGSTDGIAPDEAAPTETASTNAATDAASSAAHTPSEPIAGFVFPTDIEGLEGEHFVVYAHHLQELRVLARNEKWEITLPELEAEVFTVVPAENGFAPIGLSEMFNSGAAIQDFSLIEDAAIVWLQSSGTFTAWSERAPQSVFVAHEHEHGDHEHEHGEECEKEVDFSYDAETQTLVVELPREAVAVQLSVVFS